MRWLKSVDKGLSWLENGLAAGALAAACLLQIISVITRNISGYVIFWSEEATIYLIIYSTFIGASILIRRNEHVSVDILPAVFRGRGKKAVMLLGALIAVAYGALVALLSWMLIAEPFSSTTTTAALKLPLWAVELSIAIGMTLFTIRAIQLAVEIVRSPVDDLERDVLAEEAAAVGLDPDEILARQQALPREDVERDADLDRDGAAHPRDSGDSDGETNPDSTAGRGGRDV